MLLAASAPAAARQVPCNDEAEIREQPSCWNLPGMKLFEDTRYGENEGSTTEPGERTSCPRADGGPNEYGATLWVVLYPHADGTLVVDVEGIDAQLVLEEGSGPPTACSDDSGAVDTDSEHLRVTGVKAGRTYLLQIGGLRRATCCGAPSQGVFALHIAFQPNGNADRIPTGGAGDPDPDSDGVRGPADKCPGQGTKGRDIDQDGCRDKRRQTIDVKWRIVPTRGRGVIVRQLRLKGAGRGTRVGVRCSRGCRRTSLSPRRSRTNVSARRLKARRVPPGATIDVSVTRKGHNGEVHRFKVRRTTMEELWTRCLPEGTRRPVKGECA